MIGSIIAFLIEIGILSADFRHYYKVQKQEQKDGKKRTLSKYLLQPSVIAVPVVIGLSVLIAPFLISGIDKRRLETTTSEMNELKENVEEWRKVYSSYPTELEEITRGRPLRKEWLTDEWGQPYSYQLTENENRFILRSSGPDKIFGNSDDLEIK